MKLTGAQILIECLKEQGVDTVFGYPGGSVLYIYDELYKNRQYIRHILTSHEQGASHAADGYARSTGKTGVCIATSGPGATNLVTGIATAYMDSSPVVFITGNVPLNWLGRDSFQEVDITGITMPVTKHNFLVLDVNQLADTIREAFYMAKEGRPGPVLIDIPKDLTIKACEFTPPKPSKHKKELHEVKKYAIDEAVDMINASKHPMIYSGGGIIKSDARKEFLEFAEKINAPVTSSLMGLGGFPGDHKQFTGMVGMHGTMASNMGVTDSDLLIVLGARFSDRVVGKLENFAPKAKVLQIDIDAAEINKNVNSHYHIVGDLKQILTEINKNIKSVDRSLWINKINEWKIQTPEAHVGTALTGRHVLETLNKLIPDDAIISTEVGQHQMWTAQYITFHKNNTFLTSGGLGTMGFGLGAAIGAQIGNPNRKVINIAGDGSFRMNLNEIATAVEYKLPILMILLDNRALGMVRQWQNLFFDSRYSNTDIDRNTNFCMIAEGFGAKAYKLEDYDSTESVLKEALKEKCPVLIHCIIDRDEMVMPMVRPGDSIDQLMMGVQVEENN
jgi:acetolactate synthase-1/2/3 large subunit